MSGISKELQILFNQIVNDSKFSGPDFNINVIIELLRNKLANVYGYYINDKLIAFSTEISENDYCRFQQKICRTYHRKIRI